MPSTSARASRKPIAQPGETSTGRTASRVRRTTPSLEEAIALEDRNQVLAAGTADFREGVAAFLEKRAAKFRDA